MMNKMIPEHMGDLFTWHDGVGSTEESTLGSARQPWKRIWDDSTDVGFIVKSHKTGAKKLFVLSLLAHDDEGNITCWVFVEFVPIPREVRASDASVAHWKQGPLKIRVFND